ncbi:MAG: IS66 family insertion sequence element accessory protein TnpB [Saprospiraceae bacterium]|nr:IS66 family insertion sequence element accessory protein TnpB [Candidatus Vicinibacter affinis]
MIPFTSGHRYFVYSGIVDFRKGYNGLSGVVKSNMESNPFNGDIYIFSTREIIKYECWFMTLAD